MGDTTEQLVLIGFAARLGTCVSHEETESDEGKLRSEAQLLMNLLVSKSRSDSSLTEASRDSVSSIVDDGLCGDPATATFEPRKQSSFKFSCPSLSLDAKAPLENTGIAAPPQRERLASDESDDSLPSLVEPPAPAVALGRPLVIDDRDALRLSSEAMGRNILRTFEKALQWRKRCWVDTLSRPLVQQEREMNEAGATDEDIKALLATPEAMVIASLHRAIIAVLDARTSFRVLSQRWDKNDGYSDFPPLKKMRHFDGEHENEYTTAYVLSFQAVINISSPAGHSQVTLEAPGFIEGKFVRSPTDDVVLTGVAVEIDTRVLASMIERSSRIIARASAEAIMIGSCEYNFTEAEIPVPFARPSDDQIAAVNETATVPTPCVEQTSDDEGLSSPTIVTPRNKACPEEYCDNHRAPHKEPCFPLTQDLCAQSHRRSFLRMVSPPPGSISSDESVELQSHGFTIKKGSPSLISPPPSRYFTDGGRTEYISFDANTGPSLPALLEVASAAMMNSN